MSTTPATVQWPAGTTCSECGDDRPVDEVNGDPVCRACYDELTDGADTAALDRIAALVAGGGHEFAEATLDEIRAIVQSTGRSGGA